MSKRDKNLKKAINEIKEILKKYQLAANITFTSMTHTEFLKFFPDWSVAQFEKDKAGEMVLRIRSKAGDFDRKKDQDLYTEKTIGFLCCFRDQAGLDFLNFDKIIKELEKSFKIKHESFQNFMVIND